MQTTRISLALTAAVLFAAACSASSTGNQSGAANAGALVSGGLAYVLVPLEDSSDPGTHAIYERAYTQLVAEPRAHALLPGYISDQEWMEVVSNGRGNELVSAAELYEAGVLPELDNYNKNFDYNEGYSRVVQFVTADRAIDIAGGAAAADGESGLVFGGYTVQTVEAEGENAASARAFAMFFMPAVTDPTTHPKLPTFSVTADASSAIYAMPRATTYAADFPEATQGGTLAATLLKGALARANNPFRPPPTPVQTPGALFSETQIVLSQAGAQAGAGARLSLAALTAAEQSAMASQGIAQAAAVYGNFAGTIAAFASTRATDASSLVFAPTSTGAGAVAETTLAMVPGSALRLGIQASINSYQMPLTPAVSCVANTSTTMQPGQPYASNVAGARAALNGDYPAEDPVLKGAADIRAIPGVQTWSRGLLTNSKISNLNTDASAAALANIRVGLLPAGSRDGNVANDEQSAFRRMSQALPESETLFWRTKLLVPVGDGWVLPQN